jgi:uncharacterized glyoxalase superfamily protein PhnB
MTEQINSTGLQPNRSMPPGTIIPELVYPDLNAAVTWLCATFGFRERLRIGSHRCQLVLGEASIIAIAGSEASNLSQANATHSLMVRVADVEAPYAHVRGNGATIVRAPETYPFGERQYTVEDPGGHHWTFTQSVADVDPKEWGGELVLQQT